MILVIRPAAKDDIIRQYRYYLLQDALETATLFLEAVDASIEMIGAMPEIGAPKHFTNRVLEGLRASPVQGFEDLRVYYVIQNDVLRIIRVLHGRRNISRILEAEKDYDALN